MKRLPFVLAVLIVLGLSAPLLGAEVAIHGDFNNRFMVYTDQSGLFAGAGEQSLAANRRIKKDGVSDNWGEIKYRLWVDAATNDNKVKAVYAIELGALHFGKSGTLGRSTGGSFSGDSVNIETRWAYTDFQLPGVDSKARFRIGLQPIDISYYLWKETAMGVNFMAEQESFDYQLAWIRGYEHQRDSSTGGDDVDALLARLNFKPAEGFKIGVFGLYMTSNAPGTPGTPGAITGPNYQVKRFADTVDLGIWNVGIDGGYNSGNFFIDYDLIYQSGDIENVVFTGSDGTSNADTSSVDVKAYFAHADIGFKINDWKATYTFWYASGDDNSADNDFEGFLSVDVDNFDGVVLFESFTDDNYFTERHHLLDKGFIMNKIALDYQATPKLKVGTAGLYMLTAEDIKYTAAQNGASVSENSVGFEIDAYFKYMLFKNVEVAMEAGYLWAGDAMDYWEQDAIQNGSADEDIVKVVGRVRYKF